MPNGYVVDFKTPEGWERGPVEISDPFDIYLTRGKAEITLKLRNDALFPLRQHDIRRPFLLAPRYADAWKLPLRQWSVKGGEIFETVRPGSGLRPHTDRFVLSGRAGQEEFYASILRPVALELSEVRRALVGVLSSLVVAKNRQPFRSFSLPDALPTATPFAKSNLWQVGDVALHLPLSWVPYDMGFPAADLEDWSKPCPAVDLIKTGPKAQSYPLLWLQWARARDAKSSFAPFRQKYTAAAQRLSAQTSGHKKIVLENTALRKQKGVFHRFIHPATNNSNRRTSSAQADWIYLADDLVVYTHSYGDARPALAAYEMELQAVVISVINQLAKIK